MGADSPATRQARPAAGVTAVSVEPLGAIARHSRLRVAPRTERYRVALVAARRRRSASCLAVGSACAQTLVKKFCPEPARSGGWLACLPSNACVI
jgi:hypothetical protein